MPQPLARGSAAGAAIRTDRAAPEDSELTERSPSLAAANEAALMRAPIAGFLAWLVPGLGHIFLGYRARGLIFLVTITATFWTGVAIGGVRGTVDPRERSLWFVAQLCTGANTLAAYGFNRAITPAPDPVDPSQARFVPPHWMAAEVGVHYTGVAGLLNMLVILNALTLAEFRSRGGSSARPPPKGAQ